jgi:hypothetical protein
MKFVERKMGFIELQPLPEDLQRPMPAQLTVPASKKAHGRLMRAVTACDPASMSLCELRPASNSMGGEGGALKRDQREATLKLQKGFCWNTLRSFCEEFSRLNNKVVLLVEDCLVYPGNTRLVF